MLPKSKAYKQLVSNIGVVLKQAQETAYRAVNAQLVNAYWSVGRHIVEYEQLGSKRAEYGAEQLLELSKDLKAEYGKGFSRSNLQMMRLFYRLSRKMSG